MTMLSGPKRTPAQWSEYLRRETEPITLEEFTAGCLARVLAVLLGIQGASEHTEGMVGAFDAFMAERCRQEGTPYPSSGTVRAALDAARDERRRLGGG